MNTEGRSTVVGVFHDPSDAREAIEDLKDSGFDAGDIGILMRDRGAAGDMAQETGTRAGEGAATGLVGGGILGGLAGWLVGIGALAIPGVGPFIAAGAFGTAIAGAGIGAGVGAIVGALVGMGIPKEEAQWYANEVHGGNTLVTVNARERYDEAEAILHDNGAYDIQHRDAGMMTPEATTTTYGGSTIEAGPGRPGEYVDEDVYKEGDYDVDGGEDVADHEHQWVNGRCEICGVEQKRRAA